MIDELCSLPGIPAALAREVLPPAPWITVLAEHHLARDDVGVDLMGCVDDPWRLPGPLATTVDRRLAMVASPVYWLEWDLVAGRRAPLWSVCCEAELLAGPCDGRAPARSAALREDVLARLVPLADADVVRSLVTGLGEHGRLLHLAPLGPRGRAGHRLSFAVRAGAVAPWLRAMAFGAEGSAVPVDLAELLFDLAAPRALVGVQLEVSGGLGGYLAVESPLIRQGRPPGSMRLERWLPPTGSAGRERYDALRAWVAAPVSGARRRQMYVKCVAVDGAWSAKAYAGVTARDATAPSTAPSGAGR